MIRVLQIMSSVYTGSGVAQVMMRYVRRISDQVSCDFFIYYDGDAPSFASEIEGMGQKVFVAGKPGVSEIPAFRAHLAGVLAEGRYDVVHLHDMYLGPIVFPVARRAGVPVRVAHSHSTRFSDNSASALRNRVLTSIGLSQATHYVACSKAARVLLGGHSGDALVLNNAIECDAFAFDEGWRESARAEIGATPRTLLLGSAGRLAEQKNQHYMLVLLLGMLNRGYDCMLAIAGTGPKEQELRSAAAELGVADKLVLLGQREDVPRLYSAFDVFLLTSLFEGLPLSLVEAQASGLPCLASDSITGEASIVNTRMLPLGDDVAWLDALEGFIDFAPDRRAALAAVKAAGFDIDAEAPKLTDWYEGALGGAAAR